VFEEVANAEDCIGSELGQAVLGDVHEARTGSRNRTRGIRGIADDLDRYRRRLHAADREVDELDRTPAVAVGELHAFDDRIAASSTGGNHTGGGGSIDQDDGLLHGQRPPAQRSSARVTPAGMRAGRTARPWKPRW